MYSRGQNFPTRTPPTMKENAVGKMAGPNTTDLRPRQVLSAVNAGPSAGGPGDPISAATSVAGSSDGTLEFSSMEDMERLLSEKMKGKSLKMEKNELRDARPSFMPPPPVIPAGFAAQGKGAPMASPKLMMPVIGYPGFPMWQFMPPADVDTSKDAESCPPVAQPPEHFVIWH